MKPPSSAADSSTPLPSLTSIVVCRTSYWTWSFRDVVPKGWGKKVVVEEEEAVSVVLAEHNRS